MKIHQNMEQTKTALKAITKLTEKNNLQLGEMQPAYEKYDINSPAWVNESAAGSVIPAPVNIYGLVQLNNRDISFGAHRTTDEASGKK